MYLLPYTVIVWITSYSISTGIKPVINTIEPPVAEAGFLITSVNPAKIPIPATSAGDASKNATSRKDEVEKPRVAISADTPTKRSMIAAITPSKKITLFLIFCRFAF